MTIDSDVLIAPHHVADNGSSTAFIRAVSPERVIFSAGHAHDHPRKETAKRFLDNGVELAKILRADMGDDEGTKEWDHQRDPGATDKKGDDDVENRISSAGVVDVTQ